MTDSEPDNPGADARRKYGDEVFVEAVRELQPASAREIAEEVGCPRRTAHYRLEKLEDEGEVRRKKVGPSVIWSLSAEG